MPGEDADLGQLIIGQVVDRLPVGRGGDHGMPGVRTESVAGDEHQHILILIDHIGEFTAVSRIVGGAGGQLAERAHIACRLMGCPERGLVVVGELMRIVRMPIPHAHSSSGNE